MPSTSADPAIFPAPFDTGEGLDRDSFALACFRLGLECGRMPAGSDDKIEATMDARNRRVALKVAEQASRDPLAALTIRQGRWFRKLRAAAASGVGRDRLIEMNRQAHRWERLPDETVGEIAAPTAA